MAKQRPTASGRARKAKAAKASKAAKPKKAARLPKPVKTKKAARPGPARAPALAAARARKVPAPPPERTPHVDAMEVYERGVGALQQRKYAEAAKLLQAVIDAYPDEKELHERAQIYLNVCRRQAVPLDATPKTFEERVYAATLAINAGAYDDGLARLEALADETSDNDHVQFMLAVVRALRGEPDKAWPHLQRAIELNPENRFLARQDADLEVLRRDPQFRQMIERPPAARRERRSSRGRATR
jgi:tetratricopeptide (TPR) repeat protein